MIIINIENMIDYTEDRLEEISEKIKEIAPRFDIDPDEVVDAFLASAKYGAWTAIWSACKRFEEEGFRNISAEKLKKVAENSRDIAYETVRDVLPLPWDGIFSVMVLASMLERKESLEEGVRKILMKHIGGYNIDLVDLNNEVETLITDIQYDLFVYYVDRIIEKIRSRK